MFKQLASGFVGMVLFAAMAVAQATISVPASISVGEDISIGYNDPSRAGQTITLTIDLVCFPAVGLIEIDIQLDQAGEGSTTWTVPEALSVAFNAPGARQVTRIL